VPTEAPVEPEPEPTEAPVDPEPEPTEVASGSPTDVPESQGRAEEAYWTYYPTIIWNPAWTYYPTSTQDEE